MRGNQHRSERALAVAGDRQRHGARIGQDRFRTRAVAMIGRRVRGGRTGLLRQMVLQLRAERTLQQRLRESLPRGLHLRRVQDAGRGKVVQHGVGHRRPTGINGLLGTGHGDSSC